MGNEFLVLLQKNKKNIIMAFLMSSVIFIIFAYNNTLGEFLESPMGEFLKNPIIYVFICFINVTIELILFFYKRKFKEDVLVSVQANILFIFMCSIIWGVYIFFLCNFILI